MAQRRIDRVEAKKRFGPDAQVDDKAIVILPTTRARPTPSSRSRRTGSPRPVSSGTRTVASRR
jgi:hypothetical protein